MFYCKSPLRHLIQIVSAYKIQDGQYLNASLWLSHKIIPANQNPMVIKHPLSCPLPRVLITLIIPVMACTTVRTNATVR